MYTSTDSSSRAEQGVLIALAYKFKFKHTLHGGHHAAIMTHVEATRSPHTLGQVHKASHDPYNLVLAWHEHNYPSFVVTVISTYPLPQCTASWLLDGRG
ncbi:hypothetical protein AMTR_s00048p00210190 [Amborella trichopoda]|uniref:Uncharacterized protein n=1 Tax=Amborella trichopoda TaxID=13333 RepID=U5D0A8_AMBTC|nr:hypothetical protein AMTR_s00048p00210190 [Amborella trichopoda]